MSEEIRFEDYIGLMKNLVKSFQTSTRMEEEYEDLLSAAYEAFIHAKESYDPDRGQFSTHLWNICRNTLINYWHESSKYNSARQLGQPHQEFRDPESILIFKDLINKSISNEGQEICRLLFEEPEQYLILDRPKLSRGRVKDTLRDMGWSWSQIWTGFREIKFALNQME